MLLLTKIIAARTLRAPGALAPSIQNPLPIPSLTQRQAEARSERNTQELLAQGDVDMVSEEDADNDEDIDDEALDDGDNDDDIDEDVDDRNINDSDSSDLDEIAGDPNALANRMCLEAGINSLLLSFTIVTYTFIDTDARLVQSSTLSYRA